MKDDFDVDTPGEMPARLGPGRDVTASRAHGPRHDTLEFGEVHLLDYVRVLYKRRWTAATVFTLIMLGVTLYTFTVTPIYEAQVRLLIETENPNVVSFKQVIEEREANADYYQTQYNMLQSRSLARKTLDVLKLWNHPEFSDGAARERQGLSQPGADETAAQSRTIDAFLEGLIVAPIRNSRLVDVKYRSPDPALATSVAGTLVQSYIQRNLEYRFLASKEASDWLGERLAEQRKHVEAAEMALQQYRERNDGISLEDRQNIVVQKLADLNAAVTRAKTDRIQKEALYRQLGAIQSGSSSATLDTVPAILTNAFIQQQKSELAQLQTQYAQMSEKLGVKHPDLLKIASAIELAQTKLQGEIAKVAQSMRNEYQAAVAQEQGLTAALESQKTAALAMNENAIEFGVLQREVESNRQLYDSLLQRAKETGVSGELRSSNIRVVDQAEVPNEAVSPRKGLNLALAALCGLLAALGFVFFFEYLDSRIKTPDEITAHLGVTFVGLLPAIAQSGAKNPDPLINSGVPPDFTEAFRVVRTNVLFSSAEQGPRSLLVTSTCPGEGKSLVASNLAMSLGQIGQRVLLVDADMRKPRVHDIFDIPQEPGLSNLLVGNAKTSEALRKAGSSGLWLLPAGRIPPNAVELLGSQRFHEFLRSLTANFDWVVIDSPPVMAVADAAVVAHSASDVLFVVGAEMTARQAAQRAIERLQQARARLLGAVLNRVDLKRHAYFYSQYYRREYTTYYRTGTR
jgi:capsular exopolysaccharide synthesis family protein